MEKITNKEIKNLEDFLIHFYIRKRTYRLKILGKAGAPKLIIENEKKLLKQAKDGIIKITNLENFRDKKIKGFELLTGRGGKKYYHIFLEDEIVNFFPNAKYGAFLSIPK